MKSFIKNFNTYLTELNEGLIKTYDIDFVILRMDIILSKLNIPYDVLKNDNNTISIKLNEFYNLKEGGLDYINNNLINIFGWFPSFIRSTNKSDMKMNIRYDEQWIKEKQSILDIVEIIYESKFDKTNYVPTFLYHLSIMEYNDKIFKSGLCPKSGNKIGTHDKRIYVCSDPKYCYDLIESFKFINSDRKNVNKKWIICKINTIGLKITLYDDPNFKDKGFYLNDNIPPSNIEVYDKEN